MVIYVAIHSVMAKGPGLCERKAALVQLKMTTQLECDICGDSGCFNIWINSLQMNTLWSNRASLQETTVFNLNFNI